MSKMNFVNLCEQHGIAPDIALENEALCDALRARDDKEAVRILIEDF